MLHTVKSMDGIPSKVPISTALGRLLWVTPDWCPSAWQIPYKINYWCAACENIGLWGLIGCSLALVWQLTFYSICIFQINVGLYNPHFLADRTNGRAYATVLCPSVVDCLSVTLCIVAKRCVLEQKLLLRAYRKSYIRNRLVPKWMTLTFV